MQRIDYPLKLKGVFFYLYEEEMLSSGKKILEENLKLLERKNIGERIIEKIVGYVGTFFNGMEEYRNVLIRGVKRLIKAPKVGNYHFCGASCGASKIKKGATN